MDNQNFCRHLVVGSNLFSLILYNSLRQKEGESEVLCVGDIIDSKSVIPQGPTIIRGDKDIEAFRFLYPNVHIDVVDKPPISVRDNRFFSLGDEVKYQPLLKGEDFYLQKGAFIDWFEIGAFLKDKVFYDNFNKNLINRSITSVKKVTASNFLYPTEFLVELDNGDTISCQNLYWGDIPSKFFAVLDKSQLLNFDQSIADFSSEYSSLWSLKVSYHFNTQVCPYNNRTFFFPLSFTYPLGHHIGEFTILSDGSQKGQFIHLVDKDKVDGQGISSRIKILRKILRKYFSIKDLPKELVVFTPENHCLKFDTTHSNNFTKHWKNLHWSGFSAVFSKLVSIKNNDYQSCLVGALDLIYRI